MDSICMWKHPWIKNYQKNTSDIEIQKQFLWLKVLGFFKKELSCLFLID